MISIADLNDLDRHPQVAYPGYEQLRDAARHRNGGLIDPRDLPRMEEVARRRGWGWCRSVTGKPIIGCSLREISATEAVMLLLADEQNLDPPEPDWLVQWQAETAETNRVAAERREAGLRRDRERWATALKTCGVPVEVRPNVNGRRYGTGMSDGALRHVIPLADARSPKRRHQAGRPLCEAASRPVPRQLGEPDDRPATCKSCLTYTAQILPASPGKGN